MLSPQSLASKIHLLRGFRRVLNPHDAGGYAVAEFAMVLPGIVMVTALGAWTVRLEMDQLHIQATAQTIARTAARGDAITELIAAAHSSGIDVAVAVEASQVTVRVSQNVPLPLPALHEVLTLTSTTTSMLEGFNAG